MSQPDSGTLVIWASNTSAEGHTATIVDGVATFDFSSSPISSLTQIKLQNNDYNAGLTVTAVRVYCDSASATESYTVYYTLNYTDSSSSATQSWTTTTTDWSSAQSFSVSTNNVASVTIWLDEDVTADYFEAWGGSD